MIGRRSPHGSLEEDDFVAVTCPDGEPVGLQDSVLEETKSSSTPLATTKGDDGYAGRVVVQPVLQVLGHGQVLDSMGLRLFHSLLKHLTTNYCMMRLSYS